MSTLASNDQTIDPEHLHAAETGADEASCPYCRQFGGGRKTSRVIRTSGRFTLFPTLGCFIKGYCILIPTKHVGAYAHLDRSTLAELEPEMQHIAREVRLRCGMDVIVAEHGEARVASHEPGCNCVSHAHWHFIPVLRRQNVFMEYCKTGGYPRVLKSLTELSEISGPYLYLNVGTEQHFVWENTSDFARQYVRIVAACDHGIGDWFNWRQFRFEENIQITRALMTPGFSFLHDAVSARS